MPNPRLLVDHSDIGHDDATYKYDGTTIAFDATQVGQSAGFGKAVSLANNGIVQLASDAEGVVGKLGTVDADGFCTVQFEGYMNLPAGASATVTRGKKIVGALGPSSAKGYIRDVNTAVPAELGVAQGQIQDISDTTNVEVLY